MIGADLKARYDGIEPLREGFVDTYRAVDRVGREVWLHVIPSDGSTESQRLLSQLWSVRARSPERVVEVVEEADSKVVVTAPFHPHTTFEEWLDVAIAEGVQPDRPSQGSGAGDSYTALFRVPVANPPESVPPAATDPPPASDRSPPTREPEPPVEATPTEAVPPAESAAPEPSTPVVRWGDDAPGGMLHDPTVEAASKGEPARAEEDPGDRREERSGYTGMFSGGQPRRPDGQGPGGTGGTAPPAEEPSLVRWADDPPSRPGPVEPTVPEFPATPPPLDPPSDPPRWHRTPEHRDPFPSSSRGSEPGRHVGHDPREPAAPIELGTYLDRLRRTNPPPPGGGLPARPPIHPPVQPPVVQPRPVQSVEDSLTPPPVAPWPPAGAPGQSAASRSSPPPEPSVGKGVLTKKDILLLVGLVLLTIVVGVGIVLAFRMTSGGGGA